MSYPAVIFDVEGFLAHFRCVYSNVSSLSYHFPPRNTIIGMLAAILGKERESSTSPGYYGDFTRERCHVAVRIISSLRKLQFTTNYLDTGSRGILDRRKIRGTGERKQIPIEYLVGNIANGTVRYRFYISHDDSKILKELENRLRERRLVYPVSLGPAYCIASVEFVGTGELGIEQPKQGKTYPIVTVMPQDMVELDTAEIAKLQASGVSLRIMLEENLPPDLGPARKPIPSNRRNFYFEESGRPVPCFVKGGEVFRIGCYYGIFM